MLVKEFNSKPLGGKKMPTKCEKKLLLLWWFEILPASLIKRLQIKQSKHQKSDKCFEKNKKIM